MTYLSPIFKSLVPFCPKSKKEVLMDTRAKGPVVIRFSSPKECIDYTIKMELKYFLARLIFAHYQTEV